MSPRLHAHSSPISRTGGSRSYLQCLVHAESQIAQECKVSILHQKLGFSCCMKIEGFLPWAYRARKMEDTPITHVPKPASHDAIVQVFFAGQKHCNVGSRSCCHS